MMRKILLFIVLIAITQSCKKETNETKSKLTSSTELNDSIRDTINKKDNENTLDCDQLIYDVVVSTDITKGYEKFFTRIEDNNGEKIKIQVYIENNISDDPKTKQIVESTIAWLELFQSKKKLYNISSDPENPIEIKFNASLLKDDFFQLCGIAKKEKNQTEQKVAKLPFDYSDYYKNCIFEPDEGYCQNYFQVQDLNNNPDLSNLLSKNKFKASTSYSYLPMNGEIQPIILFYDDSDFENQILITAKNNTIISNLEISSNRNDSLLDYKIEKDFSISLFKHKNLLEKRILSKKYKINSDGKITIEK